MTVYSDPNFTIQKFFDLFKTSGYIYFTKIIEHKYLKINIIEEHYHRLSTHSSICTKVHGKFLDADYHSKI